MEHSQTNAHENVESQNSSQIIKGYYEWEIVKRVRQRFVKFHLDCLISIQNLTEYDDLGQRLIQDWEAGVIRSSGDYQKLMEEEMLKRKKYICAIEKQVAAIKSQTQNSNEFLLDRSQMLQRIQAEKNLNDIEELKLDLRRIEYEIKEIKNFQNESQVKIDRFQQELATKKKQLFKGLLPARIQQFSRFIADESFVSDQCVICMGDTEIGRNMMRLDCDGQHTFCQVCIEGWFAKHNTCPICRHTFK